MVDKWTYPPVMTISLIAEKWSKEIDVSFMDIVSILGQGIYAANQDNNWTQNEYNSGKILLAWPSTLINQSGNISVKYLPKNIFSDTYKRALAILSGPAKSLSKGEENSLNDLCIKRDDLERWCKYSDNELPFFWFGKKHHQVACKSSPRKDSGFDSKLKGGAPQSYLTEAVEFAYKYFLDEGNTEILRPGKISEFLKRLDETLKEEDSKKSEYDNKFKYVLQRIKSVKKTRQSYIIVTHVKCLGQGRTLEERTYNQGRVSNILTNLRKRFPLKN